MSPPDRLPCAENATGLAFNLAAERNQLRPAFARTSNDALFGM